MMICATLATTQLYAQPCGRTNNRAHPHSKSKRDEEKCWLETMLAEGIMSKSRGSLSAPPGLESTFWTTTKEYPFLLNGFGVSLLAFVLVLVDGDSAEQPFAVEEGSSGEEQLIRLTVLTWVRAEG